MRWLVVWLFLSLPLVAVAEETMQADVEIEEPEPTRNYVNFRVGASSGNANGRPELCLEGTPFSFLSLEACGTGSGILHQSREPEVAHFRVKGRVFQLSLGDFTFDLLVGAGVAEYQIDRDAPGLRFGDAGAQGVETAGPELTSHLRVLLPVIFGVEAILDVGVGAAYLHHAPDMVVPAPRFLPFVGSSIGAGF